MHLFLEVEGPTSQTSFCSSSVTYFKVAAIYGTFVFDYSAYTFSQVDLSMWAVISHFRKLGLNSTKIS